MPSLQSEARELIQAALDHLEESKTTSVLSSPEDYLDFRSWAQRTAAPRKKPEIALPLPVEQKSAPREIEKPAPPVQKKKEEPTLPEPPKAEPPLALEKPPILEDAFLDVRKLWAKIQPNAPILEELPSDEIAKKIAERWKTKNAVAEISILSYHEPPLQKALLEQIGGAINTLLAPAQIIQAEPIEKEKQWETFLSTESLKLTIACDYTLWQLGDLMQYYRENPTQKTRKLGAVPVFLLPDLSLYLKDPLLKRSLWKALCQTISS